MSVSVETSAGSASIPGVIRVPGRQHLAQRTLAARPSEVRKVFRAAQRPGMISFANGAPYLGAGMTQNPIPLIGRKGVSWKAFAFRDT